MNSIAGGARKLKEMLESSAGTGGLDSRWIDAAVREVNHRGRTCFWTPMVTIMTFLRQILFANCACRAAVAWTLSASAAGESVDGEAGQWMSGDPSAYSQARSRLPLSVFTGLHRRIADAVHEQVGSSRLWCGRRVKITDGSTIVMPDEPSLQKVFPQQAGQKPGCGFPMARMTALFCWASGTLLELAADSMRTHELTLLRRMFAHLRPGDVLVGDRLFCSYVDMALLREREVDSAMRMHVSRCNDMRKGKRLGKNDRLVEWRRPDRRSAHLTAKEWEAVPKTLTIRHARYDVDIPGFRSKRVDLVTTLLDPVAYPAEELAKLYRGRWRAELNLRSLKTTLGMERLHTRSVDMIRKEIAMYAVAYNLVRWLMWQAAVEHGVDPVRLSFAGTVQRMSAMTSYLLACSTKWQRQALYQRLLQYIAEDLLPDRPDRIEPRCIKRRPKDYPLLSKRRSEYKKSLMKLSA